MILFIVVPCNNEQEVLPETSNRLKNKLCSLISSGIISEDSRIVFVDDGSTDLTWRMIEDMSKSDRVFEGIKLSCNRGHQNALFAGLMTVRNRCDAVISLDADLQDDIEVIDEFVEKYRNGCDIVYGVRRRRNSDTLFKRKTAELYYRLMTFLGTRTVYNHADYRLMSRRAIDAMSKYGEVNLFLRGIVTELGFSTSCVYYDRNKRLAGESKYPLKKMLAFAADGITSFSIKPIRIISALGVILSVYGVFILSFAFIRMIMELYAGIFAVCGLVCLLSGVQLISLGIVGEYVGKTYLESKKRPRYIIEKETYGRKAGEDGNEIKL